ncbi:MAG: methyltransferase [Candidatus Odinarchaeota archaeon]
MAIVYMKALESEPSTFDKKFQKLSKGVRQAYEFVSETIRNFKPGETINILEIGCGTGYLSRLITAERTCNYTGIDVSAAMIEHASSETPPDRKLVYFERDFIESDVKDLPDNSFDIIFSTFTLSEQRDVAKRIFLQKIPALLADSGIAIIADEISPPGFRKVFYNLKRFIYSQAALVKAGKTTYPVKDFEEIAKEEGLDITASKNLKGNVRVWTTRKSSSRFEKPVSPLRAALGNLVPIKVSYCVLNGILTRKSITPGLYTVGSPGEKSPVIVTANYYWTVARVNKNLSKAGMSAWILVIDSSGINVWCGAGGGHFTSERVLNALQAFRVMEKVTHRDIILPQLCATGVDNKILVKKGWNVHWGPVDIKDLFNYVQSGLTASPAERRVKFRFGYRLLMGAQHGVFLSLMLACGSLIPLIISFILTDLGTLWFTVMLVFIPLTVLFSLLWGASMVYFPFKSYVGNALLFGTVSGIISGSYLLFLARVTDLITLSFWILAVGLIATLNALDFGGQTPFTAVTVFEADLISGSLPIVIVFLILVLLSLTGQVAMIPLLFSIP